LRIAGKSASEAVYDLSIGKLKNARNTNCRRILRSRSQFFHKRRDCSRSLDDQTLRHEPQKQTMYRVWLFDQEARPGVSPLSGTGRAKLILSRRAPGRTASETIFSIFYPLKT
jgi:hypothetical protein